VIHSTEGRGICGMMGRLSGDQAQLFYQFRLDDRVPPSHLLRRIDAVLDLSDLHRMLSSYYSHTGRPSVDPELMMRMLIVGYCFGIRSERRLCEEVSLNLAYRWFCRLGLEDEVPDHSTFGKNPHGRFRESDLCRQVFETVLRGCMASGLACGEGFAVDATVIEADASRFKRVSGEQAQMGGTSAANARGPGVSGGARYAELTQQSRARAKRLIAVRSGVSVDDRRAASGAVCLRPQLPHRR